MVGWQVISHGWILLFFMIKHSAWLMIQLCDLCKILLKSVDSNGFRLNLKKTKYMIISRARNLELLRTLKIANLPIERLTESKFLGVIVDENLTWSRHFKTIQTKTARYIYKALTGLVFNSKNHNLQTVNWHNGRATISRHAQRFPFTLWFS